MSDLLTTQIAAARAAIVAGHAQLALDHLDRFAAQAQKSPPDAAAREALQAQIAEMRELAEAALQGAKSAVAQVQAIIETARSLQTYDDAGHRRIASVVANQPRRY
ncbi:hypothetical protein [Paracoccus sp. (in: a-proteobacteria)]|uniref:hypothetical protein n=1 Tax=Paracoccus sp. TaxID=267 RepID=UPI003A89563F